MRTTNALITYTDTNLMGLYPLTNAPANSNEIVTRGDLEQWFYMDNTISPFSTYTSNRCPRYQDVLGAAIGALPNFYLYDVTRSSIPGATGAFFTYISPTGSTETVLQNTYGYVGQFCMQEGSYQNNQYNVYQISQVGVCYPDNQGTTYPRPETPQLLDSTFAFTVSPGYEVRGVAVYNNAGTQLFAKNGLYTNELFLSSTIFTVGTYYVRYFVYTTAGVFVAKFGFPGYPAYEVTLIGGGAGQLYVYAQGINGGGVLQYSVNFGPNIEIGPVPGSCVFFIALTVLEGDSIVFSDPFTRTIALSTSVCPTGGFGCEANYSVLSSGTEYVYITIDGSTTC
jgi:hypothetical protein